MGADSGCERSARNPMGLIGAIEAGGTKFVLALAREDGTVLEQTRVPTLTPAEIWPKVTEFFTRAAARHGPIGAFGIASFGPIGIDPASPDYGRFLNTTKPGWSGARFQDALGQFGVPLALDTDVNGAALGEWAKGAGRGCGTLAYTTVGTGIGSGVIHAGRIAKGFSHYETGHIPVPHDRAVDPFPGCCSFHGDCLEGLASGPAILQRWGRSLDQLIGDAAALDLIGTYLAQLATTLVLLHMPDRLVFGGGVMKAPGLIEVLRSKTEARLAGYLAAPHFDPGLERYIVAPGLGDDAGIAGAILLGRQALGVS